MARYLLGWLGILLLGTLARAELVCEQPLANLGNVKAGTPLKQRFTFTNKGSDTVELLGFQTSCGCFRPELSKRILVAGDSAHLDLVGNTLAQPAGAQAWRVRLAYREGGKDREIAFEIRATLQVELALIPASVALTIDGPMTHTVVLRDLRPQPLAITTTQTSSPGLSVRAEEAVAVPEGGWTRKLHIVIGPDYPAGRRDEVVALHSRDPDYPELRLPVTIHKRDRGTIAVRPSQALITGTPGEPLPARLILLGDGSTPVEIDRVEVDHVALKCTHASNPGTPTTLKIRVDETQIPAAGLESAVRVFRKGAQPKDPPVVIPVKVEWR